MGAESLRVDHMGFPMLLRIASLVTERRSLASAMSGMVLLALAVAMNLVRFIGLAESPPGFYVDEAAGAVTIQCLATEGIDAAGVAYPLFSDTGFGTPKPPPYLYLGLLWTRLFGFSIASHRAFSAAVVTATVVVLALLGSRLLGRRFATLVAVAASLSPWAFLSSRIAWEVPLYPFFLVSGIYLILCGSSSALALLAGSCLSLAMYSYPPALAEVPLALPALLWFARKRFGVARRYLLVAVCGFLLASVPLARVTLRGRMVERLRSIGTFHSTKSPAEFPAVFVGNYLAHLDPTFLFFKGDKNLRHSTQFCGQLGWLDTFVLGLGLASWAGRKRSRAPDEGMPENHRVLVFFLVNAALGVVPAALTDEGLPHALRAIGAWPFVSLLTGYALWKNLDRRRALLPLTAALSLAFSIGFTRHFFTVYPDTARTWFDAKIREFASSAQAPENWRAALAHFPERGVQVRYFMMNGLPGEACSRSGKQISRFLHRL